MKPTTHSESVTFMHSTPRTGSMKRWTGKVLGVMSLLAMVACGLDEAGTDPADDESSEVEQAAEILFPCDHVYLTSPVDISLPPGHPEFAGTVGTPITLDASASCPGTPELQFWTKQETDQNWTRTAPYVLGASSWTPPSAGRWCITVVVRDQRDLVNYSARSLYGAACGTIL